MKLAKEAAEKITRYVVARTGKCVCADELEPFVIAALEPLREAFVNIVKHQDVVMSNMPLEMSVTRRIAVEALALFEEE